MRMSLALLVALSVSASRAPAGAAPEAMRLLAPPPPAVATPGRGPVNLVFVTRQRGFLATTGGLRDVPRAGWVLPSEPGEIERTLDGGASWHTLWRGRLSLDALAVRGHLIVAAGMAVPETGLRDNEFSPSRRHVLLISRDGGRTWARRRLPSHGHVALQILTSRRWLAFRAG